MNVYCALSSHQWGFQSGKSTTAYLLAATQDWLNSLNKKDICCVFDLQKTFDKVPHYQLLAKLEQLQLHPIIMTWLHSYLYRREQFVFVNGGIFTCLCYLRCSTRLCSWTTTFLNIHQWYYSYPSIRERGYVYIMQMI